MRSVHRSSTLFRIVARANEGRARVGGQAGILLACLLVAPAVLSEDGPLPVGIIDFYGVRKASVEQLRVALGIREGHPVPQAEKMDALTRRLLRVRHVSRTTIERVRCHEGRAILFVGVEERGAPRVTFRSRPSLDIRLPEEIPAAYDRFMEALGAAVLRGDARDDVSQGHSLMSDPECRRIQEQFVTLAGAHLEDLRLVLRDARNDRAVRGPRPARRRRDGRGLSRRRYAAGPGGGSLASLRLLASQQLGHFLLEKILQPRLHPLAHQALEAVPCRS